MVYLLHRRLFNVIASGSEPRSAVVIVNQAISVMGLRQLST